MKKVLLFAVVLGFSAVSFTSCSKTEECTCADGTKFDEDDVPDVLGVSFFEANCSACDGTID